MEHPLRTQLSDRVDSYVAKLLGAINKEHFYEISDISLKLERSEIIFNVFHPVLEDIETGLMTEEACHYHVEVSISFLRNLSIPRSTDPLAVTRKSFYVEAHQMRLDYLEKVMDELDKVVD